ncbi:hypothetical protein BC832DRAFT_589731 [Gaertneriomyces semiglobifer]|nr:hypothetical protein BC832DRAFT_589731 [Gaertneriomyces semiglobifer]
MPSSSDDVIKFIIKDIVSRSNIVLKARRASEPSTSTDHEPTTISDTLAAFMVRAVVLDPTNGFRIEHELAKDEVERLIKLCVDRITAVDSPVMATVRMQVYFDTNFPAQADFLHSENVQRATACGPLLREIVEVKTKAIPVYEALYRKIVSYLLLSSHVGSPTDMRVVRETTGTHFGISELSAFISLPRQEKEAQLSGLAKLVTGIRLFNKMLGKGGEGIDDLPKLCNDQIDELSSIVGDLTRDTEETIQTYLALADYADTAPRPELGNLSLPKLRSAIVFRRELLIYVDALQEQTMDSRQTLSDLANKFEEVVRDLKITCRAKTAVPVDQVYPQFILLSNLWNGYMDELFLLSFRKGICHTLQWHLNSFVVNVPAVTLAHSQSYKKEIEPSIWPDSKVIAKASELMAAVSIVGAKGIEIIHPGTTTQYWTLPVEYGGFCPHTLLQRDGLVVPGDKNLGLIRHRDKLFAFACEEAARDFSRNADRYIEGVLEMAKRSPDLVQLLHLYAYFPTVEALEKAKSFTRQRLLGHVPLTSDMGCQVDTHIVDANIDPKYQWNEWELRRRGLMLVNLRTKATHSMQTDRSHYRRDNDTQHYEAKAQSTQTMHTSYTDTPSLKTYMKGLRGEPSALGAKSFQMADLTVDHDGKPVPYGGGGYGNRMTVDNMEKMGVGRVLVSKMDRGT